MMFTITYSLIGAPKKNISTVPFRATFEELRRKLDELEEFGILRTVMQVEEYGRVA